MQRVSVRVERNLSSRFQCVHLATSRLAKFDRFSAILVQGLIPASILRPELTGVLQGLVTTPASEAIH